MIRINCCVMFFTLLNIGLCQTAKDTFKFKSTSYESSHPDDDTISNYYCKKCNMVFIQSITDINDTIFYQTIIDSNNNVIVKKDTVFGSPPNDFIKVYFHDVLFRCGVHINGDFWEGHQFEFNDSGLLYKIIVFENGIIKKEIFMLKP